MISSAKKILNSRDLRVCEAKDIMTETKYDAVLSNGVFAYFPDEVYARDVVCRMIQKASSSVVILDVHDKEKEKEYYQFRRSRIENFDERYQGLEKLFLSKSLFEDIAREYDLDIVIFEKQINGYWNNSFDFDVFFYK